MKEITKNPIIIFFSIYTCLMLYQPEGLGTISAFVFMFLTIVACVISRRVTFRSFYMPRPSLCILFYLVIISVMTFIYSGFVQNYYKFIAQILLYLFLASVSIEKKEHAIIKWAFICSNIVYSILTIRYCVISGNSRYFHSSIMFLGASFDPNYIGISFVATLALLLDNILNGTKRLLCILLYIVVSLSIVLTASRGSMLSLLVSNLLVIIFFARNKSVQNIKKWIWILVIIWLLVNLVQYFSIDYANQWTRMSNINKETDNGRLELWKLTINLWKESFIFGNGLRSMINTFNRGSHSTYLQILVDSGIIGTLIMVIFFVTQLKATFQSDKGMFAMLCGLLVQIGFLDAIDNRVVWIVLSWIAMLNCKRGINDVKDNL